MNKLARNYVSLDTKYDILILSKTFVRNCKKKKKKKYTKLIFIILNDIEFLKNSNNKN